MEERNQNITAVFAIVAVVIGVFFFSINNITGNVISENSGTSVGVIGTCLIVCGLILSYYIIKRR